jgi:hypothetical protein
VRRLTSRRSRHHLVLAALALGVLLLAACDSDPDAGKDRDLAFDGPDGELLNAEAVEQAGFTVAATGDDAHLDDIRLHLDGTEVTDDADRAETEMTWRPAGLDDGSYTLTVLRVVEPEGDGEDGEAAAAEETPEPEVLHEWAFEVNATPPEIAVEGPEGAVIAGEPVTIAGTTEPGATVEFNGATATADEDGAFELELDEAPEGTITLVATDAAGNVSDDADLHLVTVPSRVILDEYRAAHLTGCAWGHPPLRDAVLDMIEEGRLNAVQLDLKDEDGIVNYDSQVELAQELRSEMTAGCTFNLEEAIAFLHGEGIPVIGRIVVFRDPTLVGWAWDNDRRDYAVQTPDGERLPIYGGGMANFANEDVTDYNIALAEEAAAAGVDHILWDYIRRPEGNLDNIVFPGLEMSVEEAVVDFTRRADEALRPYGVVHGASVYGIAATRPGEIGQDIPALADHLDYVAPMVYPDHWGPGEFDLANPNAAPYEIVYESLKTFEEATEGKRARTIPWLGDFGSRDMDAGAYIRAQIDATVDNDIREFLLWNAGSRYNTDAIEPLE